MDHVAIFNALLIVACGYAIGRGGQPERLTGLVLLLAAAMTWLVQQTIAVPYYRVGIGGSLIDVVLLTGLVALALKADRFWTLWIVALHALGTSAHIAKAIDPDIDRLAYAILVKVWSYPIILILAVATVRHQRRLKSVGSDVDWSVR